MIEGGRTRIHASRMHPLRIITVTLVSLLVAAVFAAWLGPRFLNWDDYRQTIEAVASAGLGRPVHIEGPIRLSLLPEPTLRAGQVSIADTGDGATASAAEMRLRVGLVGLFAGHVKPRDLVLQDARLKLPWPLSGPVLFYQQSSSGLHARVEDSSLEVGNLAVTAITGELAVDPGTGTLSASGVGSAIGHSWRMTARLGRTGSDGSATMEMSLDGQGPMVDTGGSLSGQIAADGSLSGRIAGRGPDLSLLLAAPPLPWRADGRVLAGGGLVVADDLELDIGGAPAHGAVALRVLPAARLDAALTTSRLDLDAWLPPLLHGGQTAVATGIDLSAEAASFSGGTLRQLRAGFDLAADGVSIRDATVVLPGDADLQLSGRLQRGRFSGQGSLSAPNLPQTLAWVRPLAPALVAAIPQGALRSATLTAAIVADRESVALGDLQGDIGGAAVGGDIAIHGGDQPAVAANLRLSAPVLDPWLPSLPLKLSGRAVRDATLNAALIPASLARLNADLTIEATRPTWLGTAFDRLTLGLRSQGGTLDVRQGILTGPELTVAISGLVGAAGRVADGRVDIRLAHASVVGTRLPIAWMSAEPLFRGPATLHATVGGEPGALRVSATATMADAELHIDGGLEGPGQSWNGTVSLRHPGAPRLLETLGFPGAVSWLGDGSLSVQADVRLGTDTLALANLDVAAGALRARGDVAVKGLGSEQPTLAGSINAETLPLPLPYAHSPEPWLFPVTHGWQGRVALQAGRILLGLSPGPEHVSATANLEDGRLRIDDLTGKVSGGRFDGRIVLDGTAPPKLAAAGHVDGVMLLGPAMDTPLDVSAGRLSATVDLSASGYSPAGLIATLSGRLDATIHDGTLDGLDAPAALALLRDARSPAADLAAVQTRLGGAISGGVTPFSMLTLTASLAHGAVTLSQAWAETQAGRLTADGTVDFLTNTVDARLTLHPPDAGTPGVGVRLSGSIAAPVETPQLAELAGWLAAR